MKKTNNIEKYKGKSGITIVALVVIIVVLIILGSISIMYLTGDDGTINQAISAKDEANLKQAKTEVNEEWYSLVNENRKKQNDKETMMDKLEERLNERLEDEGEEQNASVKPGNENNKFIVLYKGQTVDLSIDGE